MKAHMGGNHVIGFSSSATADGAGRELRAGGGGGWAVSAMGAWCA
jgi:hypothetical protein